MNVCVVLLAVVGVPLIVPVVALKPKPFGNPGLTDHLV